MKIVPFCFFCPDSHSFFQFLLSSSLRCASHLCGRSLPANRCLSQGEQTLFGVTSFGSLVNQGGKHAWPLLTRLGETGREREKECRRIQGGASEKSRSSRRREERECNKLEMKSKGNTQSVLWTNDGVGCKYTDNHFIWIAEFVSSLIMLSHYYRVLLSLCLFAGAILRHADSKMNWLETGAQSQGN